MIVRPARPPTAEVDRFEAVDQAGEDAIGRAERIKIRESICPGETGAGQAGIGFGCHSSIFVPSGSRM